MATIRQVYGNTYCIVTGCMHIPFYKLGDGKVVLMDSGFPHEGDEIQAALEAEGLSVRAILTTHVHYDHVGNHDRFRERYGADIYMSAYDAGIAQTPLTLQACFYANSVTEIARTYPYMVCRADHTLPAETGTVTIDGAVFTTLHLPGHSHCHWGYVTPDDVAYIGDLLMGKTDLEATSLMFGQDWLETLRSIDRICTTSFRAYILAHSDVVEDVRELARLNREAILDQMDWVLSKMEDWKSRQEVTALMVKERCRRVDKERVRMIGRFASSAIYYLEDTHQLEFRVEEGVLCYRRARKEG